MDMVYTQTLCWLGSFYSPLLPFITFVKVIIFFFVRKLSLFHNQKPAASPYRASSMNLFFKCVLTLAFFIAILGVGVSVGVVTPSRSCGPFRTHSTINQVRGGAPDEPYTIFGAVAESMLLLPEFPRNAITFLASGPLLAALIVSLVLVIYIYAARASGQKRLVELLRDTLKREEKDKHWLLSKVNKTLRRELSAKPIYK
ncbi:TMC7 [Bugula neritina]|uniref:TMC7 n=1 Tax=Bugula neritina TaxID=10212 RepID=A0A7J7JYS9_BUGNE|nr:TMC7 [Bugula neritina]